MNLSLNGLIFTTFTIMSSSNSINSKEDSGLGCEKSFIFYFYLGIHYNIFFQSIQ